MKFFRLHTLEFFSPFKRFEASIAVEPKMKKEIEWLNERKEENEESKKKTIWREKMNTRGRIIFTFWCLTDRPERNRRQRQRHQTQLSPNDIEILFTVRSLTSCSSKCSWELSLSLSGLHARAHTHMHTRTLLFHPTPERAYSLTNRHQLTSWTARSRLHFKSKK